MPFKSPFPPVPLETQPYGERMLDVLWRHGAANPTKKAMICAETPQFSVTYHELYHHSLAVAAFLETQGFKKGDVLLTVLPNSWEFFEVLIGAALRGIAVTGVSMLFTEYETGNLIRDSGATIIFCSDDRLDLVLKASQKVDCVKKIVVAQLSDRSKKLPSNLPSGITRFDEVLSANPKALTEVKIDVKKDVLILPYSSGTTGPPKGVKISHEQFSTLVTVTAFHSAKHIYGALNPNREVASENVLLSLPFSFMYGCSMLQMSLVLGQTVIVMHHFDEEVYLQSIQDYKIHFLFLLPPISIMLANSPNVDKYDLSSVEGALSSGAPASADICYKAINRLPNLKGIYQGYGMTETSGFCAFPVIDKTNSVTAHSGVILPNYEMKLVDSDGVVVPFGEPGELLLRAPAMMLGYLGRPEATASAFADGWYKTGDLARIDDNCYVHIICRLKEVIKTQGWQVAPAELEDILLSHLEIVDAGVIGISWDDGDEVPFAFVVRKNNNLSKDDVHEFVNGKVAEYKRLRGGIKFVDAIPKSVTGKILRKTLADMYKNLI